MVWRDVRVITGHWWLPSRVGCRVCGRRMRHSTHKIVGQRPELRSWKSNWVDKILAWCRQ